MSGTGLGRRASAAALLTAAAFLPVALLAPVGTVPASAATPTYRSWTYWHRTGGAWVFAATGPASYRPADGAIEGWRYEVAGSGDARPPAAPPSFGTLCAGVPAAPGDIRVAVVLDYGTAADARSGQHPPVDRGACARAPAGSDAATLLAAVATIRYRADGLICAFDDYPTTGCVDIVVAAAPTPTPTPPRPTPTRATPTRTPTPTRTRTPKPRPSPALTKPSTPRPTPKATTPAPVAPAPTTAEPTTAEPSATRTPRPTAEHRTSPPPTATPAARESTPNPSTSPAAETVASAATGPPASTAAGLVLTGGRRPAEHRSVADVLIGAGLLAVVVAGAALAARRRSRAGYR